MRALAEAASGKPLSVVVDIDVGTKRTFLKTTHPTSVGFSMVLS